MYEQINIFDMTMPTYKVDKPVRLIELFAGVGSQAMALRDLQVNFEHYRAVEFDKYAAASYNAIHGTSFYTTDIQDISGADLGVTETEKFCYIMTYSFPCQDLSVAGKQKGMKKGDGTRSGLLWEVERLLNEAENLPQVLLMENVPQVHSKKNMPDFKKWIGFLAGKGYSNYWQDLNAKDYGVAQNRNRCFMVSILGKWNYKFPQQVQLKKVMEDYLEDEVDEKYYINTEKAQKLVRQIMENGTLDKSLEKVCVDLSINKPTKKVVSNCITSKNRGISSQKSEGNGVAEWKEKRLGNIYGFDGGNYAGNVYDKRMLSPTIRTFQGGNQQPMVITEARIRKLTPLECWRLMGFSDKDFKKAESVNSNSQLYKQAGNSIVENVLTAVFSQMFQERQHMEDNNEKLRELEDKFYQIYMPLRRKYDLRCHIHSSLYDDAYIKIWENDMKTNERTKGKRVCKVEEPEIAACYDRAIVYLEEYKRRKEKQSITALSGEIKQITTSCGFK